LFPGFLADTQKLYKVYLRQLVLGHCLPIQRSLQSLRLIQSDLANASGWIVDPDSTTLGECNLSQRRPLLAITPRDGSPALIYTVGNAPLSIWRSPVLVRCSPAFDLDGRPSGGSY